ncbi:MAG: AAA domain-containing protein [Sutterella wadsworthensis]
MLVQGPPGTGKTHTIANLLGHFLSQGKRVLVTSHTTKALSVVKDLPPKEIQPLCVTMLGDREGPRADLVRTHHAPHPTQRRGPRGAHQGARP